MLFLEGSDAVAAMAVCGIAPVASTPLPARAKPDAVPTPTPAAARPTGLGSAIIRDNVTRDGLNNMSPLAGRDKNVLG